MLYKCQVIWLYLQFDNIIAVVPFYVDTANPLVGTNEIVILYNSIANVFPII